MEMHPHSCRTIENFFVVLFQRDDNSDGLCSTQTQAQKTQTTSTTSMDNEGDWKEQTEKEKVEERGTLD
jgi:hypothetical protein